MKLFTLLAFLLPLAAVAMTDDGEKGKPAPAPNPGANRSGAESTNAGAGSLYASPRALCIGIDHYHVTGLDPLKYAARDAEAVARVLHDRFGFETTVLLNEQATRAAIDEAIRKILKGGKDDAVIIFYSGHGQSVPSTLGRSGFLLPADMRINLQDPKLTIGDYADDAIALDDITRRMVKADVIHAVLLLDCCFSGFAVDQQWSGAASTPAGAPDYQIPSRQVITAGTDEQAAFEVDDLQHGIFAFALLQLLEKADAMTLGRLSGELYDTVRREAAQRKKAALFPQHAKIVRTNGEFWFARGNDRSLLSTAASTGTDATQSKGVTPEQFKDTVLTAAKPQLDSADAKRLHDQLPQIERAAALGDPRAKAMLAYIYGAGIGVERNPRAANYRAQEALMAGAPEGKLALYDSYQRRDREVADQQALPRLLQDIQNDPSLSELQKQAEQIRVGHQQAKAEESGAIQRMHENPAGQGIAQYVDLYEAIGEYSKAHKKAEVVDNFRKCEAARIDVKNALEQEPPNWKSFDKALKDWSERLDKIAVYRADFGDPQALDDLVNGFRKVIRDIRDLSSDRLAKAILKKIDSSDKSMNEFLRRISAAPK